MFFMTINFKSFANLCKADKVKSMCFQMIFFILMIIPLDTSLLYSTNDNSMKNFDCFYAHFIENVNKKDGTFRSTNYLTPYCRRLSSDETLEDIQGYMKNRITIENLRSQRITSTQLLQWSISLDTIEKYAIYLITNDRKYDQILCSYDI
jgi:hypothetical protein